MHVVQAGETLGQISIQYDISVEAIMAANGMDNANFLAVGQELTIPQEGAPLPTVEATAVAGAEAALPTPLPTEPAPEGEAALSIARVIAAGQLGLEAVEVINNGSSQASLQNWTLSDGQGNDYTFNQVTLFGGGAGITLHTATDRMAQPIFSGAATPQCGRAVTRLS